MRIDHSGATMRPVLALTFLGFLGWLGLLIVAIALVIGVFALIAYFGGDVGGPDL